MVSSIPPGFFIYREGNAVVIADAKGSIQLRASGDIGSSNPGVRLLGRLALALLEQDRRNGVPVKTAGTGA